MRRLPVVLAVAALGVSACGGDDEGAARDSPTTDETTRADPGAGPTVVEMNDQLAFEPMTIEVAVGEKVSWKNAGRVAHTVTADKSKVADPSLVSIPAGTPEWDSGFVGEGESFSRTFRKPGTYRYVCIPHEGAGMVGSVVVK